MALVPFVPPPPQQGQAVAFPTPMPPPPPPPPPPPVIQVSQLPTPKRKGARWPWLVIFMVLCLFEPVRILGITLMIFWILSIGMMPHVAILKTAFGRD